MKRALTSRVMPMADVVKAYEMIEKKEALSVVLTLVRSFIKTDQLLHFSFSWVNIQAIIVFFTSKVL